jgi:hypothetical protein
VIVTGGIKDYIFSPNQAKVVPFGQVNDNGQMVSGEDHTFNPATTSDTLGVIWDKAGTFTVTAKATFANNPGQSKSVTVTVQEPHVDSFKDDQKPFIFKNIGNQFFGLIHQAFDPSLPGNNFTAQVDTVPKPENKGGRFAFLQTITGWQQIIELKGGQKPININVTKTILDNWAGQQGSPLFLKGYISQFYAAATNNIPLPDGDFDITDNPSNLARWVSQYPGGNYEVRFVLKAKFKTYLMFEPDAFNGRWIAIANLPWEIDGTATYKGPMNGTMADYLKETNWDRAIVKPTTSSVLNGVPKVEFVEWDGKASDYL